MTRLALGLVVLIAMAGCAGTPVDPTTSPTTESTIAAGATEWMADLRHRQRPARRVVASAKGIGPLRQRLRDHLDTAAGVVDGPPGRTGPQSR
jgi:hypothetical protein